MSEREPKRTPVEGQSHTPGLGSFGSVSAELSRSDEWTVVARFWNEDGKEMPSLWRPPRGHRFGEFWCTWDWRLAYRSEWLEPNAQEPATAGDFKGMS
jgi:hypothetical protein